MKSSDRNNIIINHIDNHHKSNPLSGDGVKFYPECQLKVLVQAAKIKEIASSQKGKYINVN